jgi:hypothetical protein
LANRPDIIIKNRKDKTCLLIDVAIPSDKNIIQKESENKLKYENLSIKIQRMWIMKCFTIPVINCKKKFTKISGNYTRTTLNRFLTKYCHTRNMRHHKESDTS